MMSMHFVKIVPRAMPSSEVVVNWETDLPAMSPTLFCLAKRRLIEAREAAASRKQIFFPTLASDARARKCCGNLSVIISM